MREAQVVQLGALPTSLRPSPRSILDAMAPIARATFTALAAALAFGTANAAVSPITRTGKFLYDATGARFFVKVSGWERSWRVDTKGRGMRPLRAVLVGVLSRKHGPFFVGRC